MKRVTIKDIASAANVHPSVVSAVVNGNNKVIHCSEKTKNRILELVRSMDYHPNRAARGLVCKESRQIGVLCFSPKDPMMAQLVAEIQKQLFDRGYQAVFGFWTSHEEACAAFDSVLGYPVDGIICMHDQLWEKIPQGVPVVFYPSKDSRRCGVILDFRQYFRDALSYLKRLGHKWVSFFSWHSDARLQLFLDELSAARMETCDGWNLSGTGFYANALELSRKMLTSTERPDALLCRNDITAFAFINAAREAGVKVPEDISVVGMDNLDSAEYFHPPVTSFGKPADQIVKAILDALFNGAEPGVQYLRMELKIRATCCLKK